MIKSGQRQRSFWVVGNWKMNGSMVDNEMLLSKVLELMSRHNAKGSDALAQCGVAVPAPYLFQAAVRLKGQAVSWGAQDVSSETSGAFTGEISVSMLQDFEAEFALVGHSERRARHGETDAVVAQKAVAVMQGGLTPVVCVGESLQARDAGQAVEVVCGQVRVVAKALHELGPDRLAGATFAYEPIWAIGTGRSASPEQAQEIHGAIRAALAEFDAQAAQQVRVLYGGSVKAANAAELFAQPDIDGALVGGASLDANEFISILSAAKDV